MAMLTPSHTSEWGTPNPKADHVILLHGLARTKSSMRPLERRLRAEGYKVTNIGYPSRKYDIGELAERVSGQIEAMTEIDERVHFVTHSLGGILVRHLDGHPEKTFTIGRVVMIAPPNQGSEVVDKLRGLKAFHWVNGPAGRQLGTDSQSVPNQLGAPGFDCGILAGSRSVNLMLSRLIPGPDDGKVSIESTKLAGMRAHRVVNASHPLIMRKKEVMEQVVHFLEIGTFR